MCYDNDIVCVAERTSDLQQVLGTVVINWKKGHLLNTTKINNVWYYDVRFF